MQQAASQTVPTRNLEQRLSALAIANETRMFRARERRALKHDPNHAKTAMRVAAIIRQPPPEMRSMKILDLLLWVPKVGRVKSNKILVRIRISPSRSLSGLTDRQRDELIRELGA